MKRVCTSILAILLAVLTGVLSPMQALAATTPVYISEIKLFMDDYSAAEAEGYTLLKIGNNPVDLNQDAGGGLGSKGDRAVYFGYKTTTNRDESITDLALMIQRLTTDRSLDVLHTFTFSFHLDGESLSLGVDHLGGTIDFNLLESGQFPILTHL